MPPPKFARGDIVNVPMPHADGSGASFRPALIVGDPIENQHGDYILVQITSREWNGRTDYRLQDTDPEYTGTGLDNASTFRCHKLFVVTEPKIRHRRGKVGPKTMREVEARMKVALGI